jgi:hypothetical protein
MMSTIKALVVPTEGEPEVRDVDASLSGLQSFVGGHIESTVTRDERVHGYINEEGKMLGLPYNHNATTLCRLFPEDYIAGPAVFMGSTDDGDEADVPEEWAQWALAVLS